MYDQVPHKDCLGAAGKIQVKSSQDDLPTLCSLVCHDSGIKGLADVLLSQTQASQDIAKGWKSLAEVAPGIGR